MHVTGAEMTASALVHLFLALILNTEGTNCDLNNFFRFENFGGASQGILGNHASFLLDPSDINSTHHIWELDPDLKKCETFTETGDLPAQCVPCLILHEICFIISFFFQYFCALRSSAFQRRERLSVSTWGVHTQTWQMDQHLYIVHEVQQNIQGTGRTLSLNPGKHKIWTQDLWNEHQEDPRCPAIPDIGVSVLFGISVEGKACKSMTWSIFMETFYGSDEADHLMELEIFCPCTVPKVTKPLFLH